MNLKSVSLFLGFLITVMSVNAQNTSVTPFSAFGHGEVLFDNDIEQAGMGGLSVIPTNPYYAKSNFYNPAANRNLKVTSFEFGVNANLLKLKDQTGSAEKSNAYISNVSLSFPLGEKFKTGFGFQPYTASGYDLTSVTENDELNYANSFKGKGGLNSLHLIGSYNVTPEFSVGARVHYLFGTIDRIQTIAIDGLALSTDYSSNYDMSGVTFSLGGLYTKKFGKDMRFIAGAAYNVGNKLKADIENMTTTYSRSGEVGQTNVDTIQYSLFKGKMKTPQTFSVGASVTRDLHWMVGAQFDFGDWADYRVDGVQEEKLRSSFRGSIGGYWIPDFNSYKSYFNRVAYRLGGFYESTPIRVNGEGVTKYGVTFGMGLPIGNSLEASMLNLAVELGTMGKTKNFGLQENYAKIKLGFTINDIWFRKRVID